MQAAIVGECLPAATIQTPRALSEEVVIKIMVVMSGKVSSEGDDVSIDDVHI